MALHTQTSVSHDGIHFQLSPDERDDLLKRINRLMGQLSAVKSDIQRNTTCPDSVIQLLAIRGALAQLSKNLVSFGALDCLDSFDADMMKELFQSILKL